MKGSPSSVATTVIVLTAVMFASVIHKTLLLPLLATVLATTYLAYVVFQGFIGAKEQDYTELHLANHQEAEIVAAPSEQQKPDYAEISQWHLFGQSEVALSPGGDVPETQLQLKLQGVLATSKHLQNAHAFIQTPEQTQKAYKVNDQLPGGATLKTIERDKVIILMNNQHESLSLEKLKPE